MRVARASETLPHLIEEMPERWFNLWTAYLMAENSKDKV
jgi:hypothetical protein